MVKKVAAYTSVRDHAVTTSTPESTYYSMITLNPQTPNPRGIHFCDHVVTNPTPHTLINFVIALSPSTLNPEPSTLNPARLAATTRSQTPHPSSYCFVVALNPLTLNPEP